MGSRLATLALVVSAACTPRAADDATAVLAAMVAEGKTFLVPAGERWQVDGFGSDSDTVGAIVLELNGFTRVTAWPARDGRRIELAKRIELAAGDRLSVHGGASEELDAYARLVRVPERRDERDATRATAELADWETRTGPSTRVVRGDTGEYARASACLSTRASCWGTEPERDVVLWAIWDDGLVVFRVEPTLARGAYEVGRVTRERARELCATWASFLRELPRDAPGVRGFGTADMRVAVDGETGFVAAEFAADTLREWVATGRTPNPCEREPSDAVSELHASVFAAARAGVACEFPKLTLDGPRRAAFEDCQPSIRSKP
ncbi:MAG: hypothetical protein L6Q99_08705 [Planctomycetes bacterium]|nr:hypothetical protein [Planctomycetota bacterium]